jgi:outer membrane protein assembly factor BamB
MLFTLSLLLVAWTAQAEENWPQFRGPRGDGKTDAVGLPLTWSETENVRWKTAIHDRGWCSPVIWGDQIWLTTAREDGKEMFVLGLDKKTGEILHDIKLWDVEKLGVSYHTNSFASPTSAIEEGRVYVHFGSYGTACVDTASGKVLWTRRDLPCEHWRGPGSSPILFENLLIVHLDGYDFQYVVALDKETGKTVWKVDRQVDYGTKNGDVMKAFCTPIVIDLETGATLSAAERVAPTIAAPRLQLISPTSKATLAYDPRTGRELWRVRYKSFSSTGMPMFGNGLIYLNTGFGKADLVAVRPDGEGDVTGTHVAWTQTKSIGSKPSQLLVDDLIFNVHDSGIASCLDAKTGEHLWSKRLGGEFSSSPLYAEGRVYFFGEDGKTTVVRAARDYEELAVNKLDAGTMATPAVSGKALYIRTKTHLYRVEIPSVAKG